MRIIVDLQGAQSVGSRNRGIGRYSIALAKALVRNKGEHEIILVLNGLFPETIDSIRFDFSNLLPQSSILVWTAPNPVNHANQDNEWRRRSAELIREAFIAKLLPDMVILTSLVEGLDDDVVTSIGMLVNDIPTATILYDLIPLIRRKPYLENPIIESWFENKIDHMRRSALLLAISESSRQEGIDYLGVSPEEVVNISTAADPQFVPIQVDDQAEQEVRSRYGLDRPFIMCTGGIDFRKNNEGLIRAFAMLPKDVRDAHQLAIVCSVKPESRSALEKLARKCGLLEDQFVLTGYVPEGDLLALYNLCKLFVFPSLHEGFGLPALEAMSCGRPVVASNTSSLPEVVGNPEALFDPFDDSSIANKIAQALTDDVFRAGLAQKGSAQAREFSWDISARRALAAIENWFNASKMGTSVGALSRRRPKLAYISPLPPQRSGISDYSADLLPELSRHYQIDIISDEYTSDPWVRANCVVRSRDWFINHHKKFDRVLYHFGNNHLHQDMFSLLDLVPGVVVLHDFFLSGIIRHMDLTGFSPGDWTKSLYLDHGYGAVKMRYDEDDTKVIWAYPNNGRVLNAALGIILHSESSRQLLGKWYSAEAMRGVPVIPLLRKPAVTKSRAEAREALGIQPEDFVVCSFGFLSSTKLNKRLLDAWLASTLAKKKNCFLVFVGENSGDAYGAEMTRVLKATKDAKRVSITGWIDFEGFQQYLNAADLGVQLRTLSRGETSAAVLDCMNHGLATIVNAHGSLGDLQRDAVFMLPDQFTDQELIDALEKLEGNKNFREKIGAIGKDAIRASHNPRICAESYASAIEDHYRRSAVGIDGVIASVAELSGVVEEQDGDLRLFAESLEIALPAQATTRQILIDISMVADGILESSTYLDSIVELLAESPQGFRVEPVRFDRDAGTFFYARKFSLSRLGCPAVLIDEYVEFRLHDVFLGVHSSLLGIPAQNSCFVKMRQAGVRVIYCPPSLPLPTRMGLLAWPPQWASLLDHCDGLLMADRAEIAVMEKLLPLVSAFRSQPLSIGSVVDTAPNFALSAERSSMDESSWSTSTRSLVTRVLDDKLPWDVETSPSRGYRIFGADSRLRSPLGSVRNFSVFASGMSGCFLHGPYLPLKAGHYRVRIYGKYAASNAAGASVDFVVYGGDKLSEKKLLISEETALLVDMEVIVDKDIAAFEVRVWVSQEDDLVVDAIEVIEDRVQHAETVVNVLPLWLQVADLALAPKVGWVTSWNTRCGIAGYSQHLIAGIPDEISIFAAEQSDRIASDEENAYRCWKTGKEGNNLDNVEVLSDALSLNILVIQFNYGFFDFFELSRLVTRQIGAGVVVILMLHSTVDPYGDTPNWRLSDLQDALLKASRVLVHSESDVKRLAAIGVSSNVDIFPHGVLDYQPLQDAPRRSNEFPLLAAYGFCLPHKGLMELVEAVGLLHSQGRSVRLRLVNAEYPVSVSAALLSELKSKVNVLGIGNLVEFHNEFLEDEQSLELLTDANLLVFAYQETGESSSAAARYGLATKKPVAVTPLAIFDDLGGAVFRLPGTTPADIARGIRELLIDIESHSEFAAVVHAESDAWRAKHSYRAVSGRLSGLYTNLLNGSQAISPN